MYFRQQGLIQGCQIAIHSAALLTQENSDLRKANARQTRKRQLKKYFISIEIDLRTQQAQQLVNEIANIGQIEPTTKQSLGSISM